MREEMNDDPDPIFWVWTVTAVVAAIFLLYSFVALAESCGPACTGTRFVPHINGIPVIGTEDFDRFDCELYLEELDQQTPPFTRLECIEEPIARTEL
jgi:hypothetical protein